MKCLSCYGDMVEEFQKICVLLALYLFEGVYVSGCFKVLKHMEERQKTNK